jgi:predicted dehydrogenase
MFNAWLKEQPSQIQTTGGFLLYSAHGWRNPGGDSFSKPHLEVYDRSDEILRSVYPADVQKNAAEKGLPGLLQLGNPHSALLADLVDAIHHNRAPLASGESGREAVALVSAIYQSALEKRIVTLPLQAFDLSGCRIFSLELSCFQHEEQTV